MNRLTRLSRFVWASAAACLMASACGGSTTGPTQVVPPPPPPALKITCPDSISLQSSTGEALPVRYSAPTSTGGTAPVQITCTPASDSVFPIGSKTVACVATDSKNVTDQCSFSVTITAPPKISQTTFVAFGDSMTAGEIVSEGAVPGIHTLLVDSGKAYPTDLATMLRARYLAQAGAIQVANAGRSGEATADGLNRLPTIIDGGAYRVLLLMEGVNDFPNYQTALINMQSMVRYAKRRSELIYLGTVPPQRPTGNTCVNRGGNWAFVEPYNSGLRSIAAAEGVTLVDVYADFHGDTTTLIDCDGLHPTAAGYTVIATSFFTAIKATLEVPVTTTAMPTITLGQPFIAPQRRGGRSRSRD